MMLNEIAAEGAEDRRELLGGHFKGIAQYNFVSSVLIAAIVCRNACVFLCEHASCRVSPAAES